MTDNKSQVRYREHDMRRMSALPSGSINKDTKIDSTTGMHMCRHPNVCLNCLVIFHELRHLSKFWPRI